MAAIPNDLLLDIYACADQPPRWQAVLDRMCDTFAARSAVVQVLGREGHRLHRRWEIRDTFSFRNAELHDMWVNNDSNPRLDLGLAGPLDLDVIVRDRDRFTKNCPHFARLEQRLAAAGLGHAIMLSLPMGDDLYFTLLLHRVRGDERAFDVEAEALLREVAPHIRQMLRLGGRLGEAAVGLAAFRSMLDQLRLGVIVCDGGGYIEWMNQAGTAIAGDSPHLALAGDKLRCSRAADGLALARILKEASAPGATGIRSSIAVGVDHANPLHIVALPAPPDDILTEACLPSGRLVTLLLTEAWRPPVLCPEELGGLFNLSPAEARLAAALCTGQSVSDYAAARGVSVGTARIQLKQVLAKTNARRQSDLVRQLCQSVAGQTRAVIH